MGCRGSDKAMEGEPATGVKENSNGHRSLDIHHLTCLPPHSCTQTACDETAPQPPAGLFKASSRHLSSSLDGEVLLSAIIKGRNELFQLTDGVYPAVTPSLCQI